MAINATGTVGYVVDTYSVVGADSNVVGTSSSFTMPAQAVTVTVTFKVFVASSLIISEVADPSGTGGGEGRFVELYNAGASSIDLAAGQWYLARQANGQILVGGDRLHAGATGRCGSGQRRKKRRLKIIDNHYLFA